MVTDKTFAGFPFAAVWAGSQTVKIRGKIAAASVFGNSASQVRDLG